MIQAREFTPCSTVTPIQRQLWEAHRARMARMAEAARKARRVVAKPAPVVEIQPTVANLVKEKQTPQWTRTPVPFDAHVITYRHWKLALEMAAGMDAAAADMSMFVVKPRKLIPQIVAEVLEDFPGITFEDLKGRRRNRIYVRPRQIAMYEVYTQWKDLSFPAIGRLFGGRDHTTVIHAVRKIEAERAGA